ncbi:MAG TPA: DUF3971 domain-containing protein, partial [Candidatus Binatia bacterium]|nr:DUF3971 domain-containing protein [Candidatus Binatia bacterium]
MRRVLKVAGFLFAVLILFIIVAGFAVYHLVRVGEVQRFLMAEIEKRTELETQLGGADLEIGWITGISFNDLALSERGAARPAITARKLTARLAILPLLRRQVIFYEIRLQEPVVHLLRDAQGRLPLIDKLLALQFFREQQGDFNLDLHSIKIDNGDIALFNQRSGVDPEKWRAVDVDLDIERLRGQRLPAYLDYLLKRKPVEAEAAAIAFDLQGAVLREEARIRLKARGSLAFPQETLEFHRAHWDGDIDVVNFPAALIKDQLGATLPVRAISGDIAQRVHVEGNPETSLRLKGSVEFRQLSIDAPEFFIAPLAGVEGRATFAIDRDRTNFAIRQIDFRSQDISVSLRGGVALLDGNDARVQLTASAAPASVATLVKYFPVRITGSPRAESMLRAVQSGQVEIKKAAINATLSQLRRPLDGDIKQFSLEAELRDFAATPDLTGSANALPLRAVSGSLRVANGIVSLSNFRGAYGDSRFDDVDGSYDFAGPAPGNLAFDSRGVVNLAELREQLKALDSSSQTGKALSVLHELDGRARLQLAIKRSPDSPVEFEGAASIDHGRVRYDEFSLSEITGQLAFTHEDVTAQEMTAQLAGSPIQIRLRLKDYNADDGAFDLGIESPGIRASLLSKLLLDGGNSRDDGVVRGAVRYAGL